MLPDCGRSKHDNPSVSGGKNPPQSGGQNEVEESDDDEGFLDGILNDIEDWWDSWSWKKREASKISQKIFASCVSY